MTAVGGDGHVNRARAGDLPGGGDFFQEDRAQCPRSNSPQAPTAEAAGFREGAQEPSPLRTPKKYGIPVIGGTNSMPFLTPYVLMRW